MASLQDLISEVQGRGVTTICANGRGASIPESFAHKTQASVRFLQPSVAQHFLRGFHLTYSSPCLVAANSDQSNQLAELHPDVGQLHLLTELSLYTNHLQRLPASIGRMQSLTGASSLCLRSIAFA